MSVSRDSSVRLVGIVVFVVSSVFVLLVLLILFVFPDYGESELDELIRNLKDKHAKVRKDAALALGKMGPAAKDAIPALTEALKREYEYEDVRDAAQEALQQIKGQKIKGQK